MSRLHVTNEYVLELNNVYHAGQVRVQLCPVQGTHFAFSNLLLSLVRPIPSEATTIKYILHSPVVLHDFFEF